MLVHKLNFKVAGVTFENEDGNDIQAEFKRIVNEYKRYGEIDETQLYGGATNQEIKEGEYEVDELDGIAFEGRIEEGIFENEICYKVYLKDVKGAYIHIGYVPRRKIEELHKCLSENLNVKSTFYIIGGKFKSGEDGKVVTDEDTYGAEITMSFFNNEDIHVPEAKSKEKPKEKKPKTKEEKLKVLIMWLTAIVIVCVALAVKSS